jgi:hypothetical protein
MNIIFLTRFDPTDIKTWSGTLYHIYNQLKKKHNIVVMGEELIGQLAFYVAGNFPDDTYLPIDRYIESLSQVLSERINSYNFNLVFFGDLLLQPTNINIPIVTVSDLTYEQVSIHHVKPDIRTIEPCIKL